MKKKKEKQNTKRENAKLSQGYFVGRTAMGYFQSQNYTKERLSSTLQQQSQQDSAAAPTSRTPHHTLEALIRRDNSISAFCLCIIHTRALFFSVKRELDFSRCTARRSSHVFKHRVEGKMLHHSWNSWLYRTRSDLRKSIMKLFISSNQRIAAFQQPNYHLYLSKYKCSLPKTPGCLPASDRILQHACFF